MYVTSPCGNGSIDVGNVMHEEFTSVLGYFCYGLFLIGEDGFGTKWMTGVWELPARHKDTEDKFYQLSDHSCTPDGEPKGG